MTSWSKMDASFFVGLEVEEFEEVLSALDQDMGDVLRQLNSRKVREVTDDLDSRFSMKVLTETRTSLFRVAMDRVDHCLSQVAKAREDGELILSQKDEDTVSRADKLFRTLEPKVMINRKCTSKLANDVMELLLFDCGGRNDFPTGMLRAVPSTNSGLSTGVTPNDILCLKRVASIILDDYEGSYNSDETNDIPVKENDCVPEVTIATNVIEGTSVKASSDVSRTCDDDQAADSVNNEQSDGDQYIMTEGSEVNGTTYDAVLMNDEGIADPCEQSFISNIDTASHQGSTSRASMGDTPSVNNDTFVSDNAQMDVTALISNYDNTIDPSENETPMGNVNITAPGESQEQLAFKQIGGARVEHVDRVPAPQSDAVKLSEPVLRQSQELVCEPKVDTQDKRSDMQETRPVICERVTSQYANQVRCDQTRPNENAGIRAHQSHHSVTQDEPQRSLPVDSNEVIVKLLETLLCLVQQTPILSGSTWTSMAGRRGRDEQDENVRRDDEERRRYDRNHENRLQLLEEWRESYTRRTNDTEDAIVERLRRVQIQNDVMTEEMRRMRRQMSELSNIRPMYMTPMVDDISTRHSTHAPAGAEGGRPAWRPERPRAASFAGRTTQRESSEKQRHGDTAAGADKGDTRRDNRAAEPKPQRAERRRQDRRTNHQEDGRPPKPSDNPLSQWLTSVRKDSQSRDNPPRETAPTVVIASPSWADEDDLHGEDDDASRDDSLSPASAASGAVVAASTMEKERRDGTPPRMNGNDIRIPPSGQITKKIGTQPTRQPAPAEQQRGNGGARPKTRGKGAKGGVVNKSNSLNKRNVEKNDGKKVNDNKGSSVRNGVTFAKVVTRSGWKTATTKKRKYDKVSPKAAFPLKGIAATVNRDVYMQGLCVGECESKDDIIESVRSYCMENGVTPIFIRIIPVKYDCTRTGCRVTVVEEDFERVLMNDFWPENIRVREWTQRPRDNDNEVGDVEMSSDNDE